MLFWKKKDRNITSNMVRIVIMRPMANKLPIVVAEFDAIQEKDESYNLVLKNEDVNFKEDLNIVKNDVIEILKYKLNLMKKTKREKLDLINRKITTQEQLIKDIKEGKVENKKYNIIDEENRLRQYKILKYAIENDGEGSYELINKEGVREMHFLSHDGILYPIFYRAPTDKDTPLTAYPDIVSKRKLYKEEQDLIDRERMEEQRDIFGGITGTIIKVLIVIMLIANIIWMNQNINRSQEISKFLDSSAFGKLVNMAEGSAIKCAYYYSTILENEDRLSEYARKYLMNESLTQPIDKLKDKDNVEQLIDLTNNMLGVKK